MDKKKLLVLVSAVVFGLLAVFLAGTYMQSQQPPQQIAPPQQVARPQPAVRTAEVLVARTNINRGASLESRMFGKAQIPLEFVQPMAATSVEEIQDKIALLPILRGEQLLLNKVGSYGEEASLTFSMQVPQGMRAITVVVDRIAAAGGMMRSGDYVDIFCIIRVPGGERTGGREEDLTLPLFQRVLALNVSGAAATSGRAGAAAASNTVVVTLALTPEQAGAILYAQEKGKLIFSLRAPSDTQMVNIPAIDLQTLFNIVYPQQDQGQDQPAATQQKPGIEVFQGLKKSR